jgi:dolichol-phosphate mannosyltransferase
MQNNECELSIILPSYLEAENLRLLLPRLKTTIRSITTHYEILVIDTQVPLDETKEVCEAIDKNVRYFNRCNSNSYGDAIRTGISEVKGKYTIFMDSDGSHTPEFIQKLYDNRNKYQVVMASRYIEGGYTDNAKLLIFMSKILNKIYSFILNLRFKDISNSFKLYDTKLLKNLILKCDNFDIVEEILYKIVRNNKNVAVKEIPYTFKKRMFGETKRNLLSFMITFTVTLVRLRLSLVRFDLISKYLIAAVTGLIFDFSIYILLLKLLNINYIIAGFVGFCVGFFINFTIGRQYVFTKGTRFNSLKNEMISVLIISGIGIAIHQGVLIFCVEIFLMNKIFAKIVAVGINFFWNYLGRRFFVYKD